MFGFKSKIDSQDVLARKIAEYSRILKVTNNLTLTGTGQGFKEDKIAVVAVDYDIYKDVQIKDARINIVNLIQFYLYKINNDPDLANFLVSNPFGYANLKLGIGYMKPNGRFSDHVAYTYLKDDCIFYTRFDQEKDTLVDLYKETYAEALAIVNGQKSSSESE